VISKTICEHLVRVLLVSLLAVINRREDTNKLKDVIAKIKVLDACDKKNNKIC